MSTELSMNVPAARAQSGFTLLELVVVMGLLSTFLLLLVQLVSSGAKLFDEGESGQDLADRTLVAHRADDDPRRTAARSTLWLVAMGGVNAASIVAVLPLVAVWFAWSTAR